MRNNNIGDVLKEYRKKRDLTVGEVAVTLQSKYHLNVAEKTIYGWESNQAHPTSDMFLVLCEIYQIHDILDTFQGQESQDLTLSFEEQKIITQYRKQEPGVQTAIKRVLGIR